MGEYEEFSEIDSEYRRKWMWYVLIADIVAIAVVALLVHAWASA